MATAALAMAIAQSPLADAYFAAQHLELAGLSVLHWINDGLMAVFFLVVGLEIKREMLDGQLSTWSRRVLPGIAALGGMAVPALLYLAFNGGDPEAARGWAIPTATDIAFALGVLALLGSRVPVSLKVFLTALAILDDLGAVVVIALFYTGELSPLFLALAAGALAALALLNRFGVVALTPYLLLGVTLWAFVLRSGVHATLAGVALALTIPLRPTPGRPDDPRSPLHRLERGLHPWVAFGVMPIFALANAGVTLDASTLGEPPGTQVALAVALGLLVGKPLGIAAFAYAAARLRLAALPAGVGFGALVGAGFLGGIGFTMALFITALAFGDGPLTAAAKVGVLGASVLACIAGLAVLARVLPRGGSPGSGA